MTSQEAFNPNSPKGNEYPEWFNAAQLTDEQQTKLVASRIAKALLDPDSQLILETLYEGSSFTPTIGGEIGFASGEHDLDPVRAGIKELKKDGVLEFERNDITEIENVEITDDKTMQREIPVLLIRVIFDQEKAQNFITE